MKLIKNKRKVSHMTTINDDQIEDAIDQIELKAGINMDTVVKHMDNEVREGLHTDMHKVGQFLSEISFLRIYIKAHFEKFGAIFQVN